MKEVAISTEFIKLDQFLKFSGITLSGSEAKDLILQGKVRVNGSVEERRGRKLYPNDRVEVLSQEFLIR